jgi:hypothetical protein
MSAPEDPKWTAYDTVCLIIVGFTVAVLALAALMKG